MVCVEDPHASDYLRESIVEPTDGTSLSDRELAHEEYIRDLESAWRNPTGSPAPQRLDPTKDVQRPDLTKDVATIQKEHSAHMQALYNQIDQEISEAYKAR
jgi:hypothetical protein